ncbi:MAG: hypothetical protein SH859_11540 [Hyphomicrobium aestuarii]|nr:hypothetical protein [Hyphomicrobium aestuarii]
MSLPIRLYLVVGWLAVMAAAPAAADDDAMRDRIGVSWNYDKFAELEEFAARIRSTGELDPDGVPKLTKFYRQFAKLLSIEVDGGKVHEPETLPIWQTVERWKAEIPNSPTLPIIEAIKIIEWVRDWRIAGSYIQESGYQPARNAVAEALNRLDGIAGDPHALTVKAQLMCLANVMEEDLILLAEEAAKSHPRYSATFEALVVCFTRRNRGEREKQFILANSLVSSIAKNGGDASETYARMYLAVSYAGLGDRIFAETGVQWSRMKDGLMWIADRYPAHENNERLGLYACLAGDRPTARTAFTRIKTPTRKLWGNLKKFEDCQKWSKGEIQIWKD